MDDEKFEEFGKKLNVNSANFENNKPSIWLKKTGFFIVQALLLAVASVFGVLLGLTEHYYQSFYPFSSGVGLIGGLGLVGINVTNWKISLNRDPTVGKMMKKGGKIAIILFTAILSLVVYLPMFGLTASSDKLSTAMIYDVYTQKEERN